MHYQELEVGEFTTFIVVGISQPEHHERNQHIQDYANKIKGSLRTDNSRIGKVIVKTYQSENNLLSGLPSDLEKAVKGEL